jgi:hypothetical protein
MGHPAVHRADDRAQRLSRWARWSSTSPRPTWTTSSGARSAQAEIDLEKTEAQRAVRIKNVVHDILAKLPARTRNRTTVMHLRSLPACACVVGVLLGLAACQGAPSQRPVKLGPVNEGPGSIVAARKFLEGRWTLESFDFYPAGKPPIALKGTGTLIYDDYGNLKIDIRADQASSDLLRAGGLDIPDGGDLVFREDPGRPAEQDADLRHRGPDPRRGPMATNRPRHWVVDGTLLTLTTKDDAGKPTTVGQVAGRCRSPLSGRVGHAVTSPSRR